MITNKDIEILDILSKITKVLTNTLRAKIAAGVFANNNLIVGSNKRKTHPFQKRFQKNEHNIFIHAEVDCILKALSQGINLSLATLYVARTKLNGNATRVYGLAKPCTGCQRAIKQYKIKRIVYTLDEIGAAEIYSSSF